VGRVRMAVQDLESCIKQPHYGGVLISPKTVFIELTYETSYSNRKPSLVHVWGHDEGSFIKPSSWS
jgi:hypothetical protein